MCRSVRNPHKGVIPKIRIFSDNACKAAQKNDDSAQKLAQLTRKKTHSKRRLNCI
jgi:hypothetical protein